MGWHIANVTDNGNPVLVTDPQGMDYTVEDVTEDHLVQVIFQINTYAVNAQVVSGQGTVAPPTQQVAHGSDSAPIAITPQLGWHIANVTDNGAEVPIADPAGMSYVVQNVTSDHEVLVTLAPNAAPAATWYLAEGCAGEGFETWVLVQNPGEGPVTVDLTFMTSSGPVDGPQGFTINARSRHTFRVNDYVTDWHVSTRVTATGDTVICERAMYGGGRAWAHDSVGYAP